jgi:hypothetical protein
LCIPVITLFLAARRRWDLLWKLLHPALFLPLRYFPYGMAAHYGSAEKVFGLQFLKKCCALLVHGEGGTGVQADPYFIPYLFTLGLPWTLLLPFGLLITSGGNTSKMIATFSWGSGGIFVFFSLSAAKRLTFCRCIPIGY